MIVIPMAGLSRRFSQAGYQLPKYMLQLEGRSLFAHSVGSFAADFASERFLFIARDEADTRGFMDRELESLGIARTEVSILDGPTRGQADTVRLGLQRVQALREGEPLTIFNIDTFRPGFRQPLTAVLGEADGWLEVMEGTDAGFSFALPAPGDEDAPYGRVLATAEKRVISRLASTGVYGFRRASDFMELTEEALALETKGEEVYVAPLYNRMLARGGEVRFVRTPPETVIFCGTPSQYEALLTRSNGASAP